MTISTSTRLRILVADDDRFVRDYLDRHLGASDYEVECVPSGDEALTCLGQSRYAAFFVDIHMEGTSGCRTIERAREIAPEMPILVMTGDESIGTERTIRHLEVFYYFVKPLEIAEIYRVLRSALRGVF